MIEAVQQQFRERPAEERLVILVGYLQLARRQVAHMIRDCEMAGDEDKAEGIAAGYELASEIVDAWFSDIAREVAGSVDMAHALHWARMRQDRPF